MISMRLQEKKDKEIQKKKFGFNRKEAVGIKNGGTVSCQSHER